MKVRNLVGELSQWWLISLNSSQTSRNLFSQFGTLALILTSNISLKLFYL